MPKHNPLLEYLASPTNWSFNSPAEQSTQERHRLTEQHNLITMHQSWLNPIHAYLTEEQKQYQSQANAKSSIASDQSNTNATANQSHITSGTNTHPIYYFNQQTATEILVPLLKASHNFDLTRQQLQRVFPQHATVLTNDYDQHYLWLLKRLKTKAVVLACAKKIVTHAKGSLVIAIGQTPIYLVAMLEALNTKLPIIERMELVSIAYSGHPNSTRADNMPAEAPNNSPPINKPISKNNSNQSISLNADNTNATALNTNSVTPMAFKNILTPTHEQFFREYLRKKNIYPERFAVATRPNAALPDPGLTTTLNATKSKNSLHNTYSKPSTVFLLDFSTGQSIAHFALLMAKWFNESNISLPDLIFMNMATKEDIHIKRQGKWQRLSLIEDLDFKIDDKLSIGIDTFYLDLPYEVLINFANIHDSARFMPPFPAISWEPNMADILEQQYPKPSAKSLYQAYYDYALKH